MRTTRRDLLGAAGGIGAALAFPAPLLAMDDPSVVPAKGVLSNPKASPEARALYAYLWSIYGKQTLTGQQESIWSAEGPRAELNYLQQNTGKLPAVLGLDYIDPADWPALADRATKWYEEEGGIPTICWHWGAPDIGTGYENSKRAFDVGEAFKPDTPQNKAMGRDLALVADQLAILRDRKVPVLWRPFHEFSGTWFWWGQWGASGFKALWNLMYEYYTVDRGLDNLIWVLGYAGQDIDKRFYPGRARVDIAGADTYASDHGNLAPMFKDVKRIVGDDVPICLHENGPVPDPAKLGTDSEWLWFMTWHTRWLTGSDQNTPEQLKAYFNSDRYLTKDELTGFKPA